MLLPHVDQTEEPRGGFVWGPTTQRAPSHPTTTATAGLCPLSTRSGRPTYVSVIRSGELQAPPPFLSLPRTIFHTQLLETSTPEQAPIKTRDQRTKGRPTIYVATREGATPTEGRLASAGVRSSGLSKRQKHYKCQRLLSSRACFVLPRAYSPRSPDLLYQTNPMKPTKKIKCEIT